MPKFRIWSAEYPEDGTQWEGEAESLEDAKGKALAEWGDSNQGPDDLDGCDATGLPPILDEKEWEAVRTLREAGVTPEMFAQYVANKKAAP